MTLRQGDIINSDLPSGWETASPYGGRMVIKRQEPGGKGDAQKEGHTVRHEPNVVTLLSKWLRSAKAKVYLKRREEEPANVGKGRVQKNKG